jgi:hypothetical protein
MGFNAGGNLAFFFTRRVGVGATMWFSGARVELPGAVGSTQEVKVGGGQAGGLLPRAVSANLTVANQSIGIQRNRTPDCSPPNPIFRQTSAHASYRCHRDGRSRLSMLAGEGT